MSVLGGVERRTPRAPGPAGTSSPGPPPHDRPSGSGWSRWVVRAGVLLILAGFGVFAWMGWQLYGTNWLSQRTQRDIVEQLEKAWADPTAPGESPARMVQTDHGPARAIVRIPELGEDYAIPVLDGTSDRVLAAGFGHYDGSVGPGEVGNYALAGHRITHGEPLRDMPELEPGDRVEIETYDATYVYELTSGGDDLVVPSSQMWVVDPRPDNPQPGGVEPGPDAGTKLLTLTSCSELFHTDNRFVAFGRLVDVVRR